MTRRGRAGRARGDADIEDAARIVQRLAVLLSAGVSSVNAWKYLDTNDLDAGSPAAGIRVVRAAGGAASRGDSVADAIAGEAVVGQAGEAWRAVAAAWEVATRSGAPLAGCLRQLATSPRDLGQLHADLDTALAGPAATARLVAFLPLVGILFGLLLGFNTAATLFLTVPGWLCLAGGTGLMLAGRQWNRRLLRRARARAPTPGLELDLTAIAISGGGSVERARNLVAEVLGRYQGGDRSRAPVAEDPGRDVLDGVLDLAVRAGVPAAELLRSEAEQRRRDARTEGQQRAVALGISLLIPLGACVLPAFMVLGVVPLLMTVLSTTLSEF